MNKKISSLIKLLFRSQKYDLVDKNSWLPFHQYEDYFAKYKESLQKTNQIETDNFSKRLRVYSLIQLVNYVIEKNKFQHEKSNKQELNFAECGCWKGASTYLISSILKKNNFKGNFFIFDSFEGGLSKFGKKDYLKNEFDNNSKKNEEKIRKYFCSDEKDVRKVLSEFNFINILKGWIPERFENVSDKKFNFVHIDVDLYEPTLESLKFFYPKLENKGIIVCDDYNSTAFPGAKKAWDEFFDKKKRDLSFHYESPFGSAFLIK